MKKILMAVLCLSTLFSFAQQLTVSKLDGTPINDGDVLIFTSAVEPANYLGLKFGNTSATEDLYVKARVVSISNATGSNLQFCVLNVCLSTISEGTVFPNFPTAIPPQSTNGDFDHFFNAETGIDPNVPIDYVLQIFQVDESGVAFGDSVTFTYRYDATLATEGFTTANADLQIKSTVVSNELEVKAPNNGALEIFDMTGKIVAHQNLISGANSINVSELASGTYIAHFKNDAGQTTAAKFVKR